MPTMIGIKNSNFDPQAYAQLTQENSGPASITTEDVLEGWRQIKGLALSPEFVAILKKSPMFIHSQSES